MITGTIKLLDSDGTIPEKFLATLTINDTDSIPGEIESFVECVITGDDKNALRDQLKDEYSHLDDINVLDCTDPQRFG